MNGIMFLRGRPVLPHTNSLPMNSSYGVRLIVISGDMMNALQGGCYDTQQILYRLFDELPSDALLIKTNGQPFGAVKSKNDEGYRDAVGMLVASKEWPVADDLEEIEIRLEDVADVKVPLV